MKCRCEASNMGKSGIHFAFVSLINGDSFIERSVFTRQLLDLSSGKICIV